MLYNSINIKVSLQLSSECNSIKDNTRFFKIIEELLFLFSTRFCPLLHQLSPYISLLSILLLTIEEALNWYERYERRALKMRLNKRKIQEAERNWIKAWEVYRRVKRPEYICSHKHFLFSNLEFFFFYFYFRLKGTCAGLLYK